MTDRRSVLAGATAPAGTIGACGATAAPPAPAGRAQWIWYPGQLAAYRLKRRVRLAVQRGATIGRDSR